MWGRAATRRGGWEAAGRSKFSSARFYSRGGGKIAGHGKKCGHGGFVGALREFGGYSAENQVCTKTVYKYISEGLMETKTTGLPNKLKRKPSRKGQGKRKNKTKLGKSIGERPEEAENRETWRPCRQLEIRSE